MKLKLKGKKTNSSTKAEGKAKANIIQKASPSTICESILVDAKNINDINIIIEELLFGIQKNNFTGIATNFDLLMKIFDFLSVFV